MKDLYVLLYIMGDDLQDGDLALAATALGVFHIASDAVTAAQTYNNCRSYHKRSQDTGRPVEELAKIQWDEWGGKITRGTTQDTPADHYLIVKFFSDLNHDH